jgi:uncharacterized protein
VTPERPTPGQLEQRSQPLELDGRRIRGVIPFNIESRDLGGYREIIEPTALRGANLDDLTLTIEHAGIPLARSPRTLQLEERSDGMHWSAEPPSSRQDVIEAIDRGDLRSASFRMKVARDEWRGDVRHVHEIAELRDVSLVSAPAYPSASVELRSQPMEAIVPDVPITPVAPEVTDIPVAAPAVAPAPLEDRSVPVPPAEPQRAPAGSLRVEDRAIASGSNRGLAELFRDRGFPGERAVIEWDEFESRAVTWSASVDVMNQARRMGGPLGLDQRYAWPAFRRIGVSADTTSVAIVQQTARALATAANVIRAIDATTAKPETASTLNLATVPLKQVATIQTNVPNVYLLQPAINSIIEQDLRLAINEGLDKLVLDLIATAGFQAPGTDQLLVSIRKAKTTLLAAGYNPDTVILTPADDQALDVLVSGITGGVNDYVMGVAVDSESPLFNMNRRISKTIPASTVVDSQALGALYASPVSLARFENLSGTTNSSNIRLELQAAFGLERVAAACRIAAS